MSSRAAANEEEPTMDRRVFLRTAGGLAAFSMLPRHLSAKEGSMVRLEGLRAVAIQDDNLHLGFIKGSLQFLGIDVSAPWLAGGTGHAFIICISPGVCLGDVDSALQDAYVDGTMARLGRNLGYELDFRFVDPRSATFEEDRQRAWSDLRNAVISGNPCYMYTNFCNQMISGYDDEGIYLAGNSFPIYGPERGPIPLTEKDGFQLTIVRPGEGVAEDAVVVREGISFAFTHQKRSPANHGLAAYDNWIEAIRTRESTGTWRTIRAWHACRSLGVDFLAEAKQRLGGSVGSLCDAAREHYGEVAAHLGSIAERSATAKSEKVEDIDRGLTAKELLAAREAEEKGLEALRRIVAAL